MKHGMALLLALILVFCATACAEAFTPITVDGSNYLNNLDTCICLLYTSPASESRVCSMSFRPSPV